MAVSGVLVADLFFMLLGLSVIIDVIILVASMRARRIRKIRILNAVVVSSFIMLVYLLATALNLFGYISFSAAYAGILVVFLLLLVFYSGMIRGLP